MIHLNLIIVSNCHLDPTQQAQTQRLLPPLRTNATSTGEEAFKGERRTKVKSSKSIQGITLKWITFSSSSPLRTPNRW